uniref:BHLH domain-containing protein n=1 Tax=Parascaris equorum TaxID=6256 RepID=A0A914SGH0_PAREQ
MLRHNATEISVKERKRNEEMNQAYEQLQKCVPHIPNDQKLPKIKTLRLALRYIKHLQDVLKGSEMFH